MEPIMPPTYPHLWLEDSGTVHVFNHQQQHEEIAQVMLLEQERTAYVRIPTHKIYDFITDDDESTPERFHQIPQDIYLPTGEASYMMRVDMSDIDWDTLRLDDQMFRPSKRKHLNHTQQKKALYHGS
jgi:hypothetical protein